MTKGKKGKKNFIYTQFTIIFKAVSLWDLKIINMHLGKESIPHGTHLSCTLKEKSVIGKFVLRDSQSSK